MAYLRLGKFLTALLSLFFVASAQSSWDHALFTSSPPVYPSPSSDGIGWEAAFAKARTFVANLTLDEKAGLLTGNIRGPCVGNLVPIPRLGFKGLCMQDGPAAIRQATFVSVFPAGLTIAATWDRKLMNTRGSYLAAEFKAKGAHVVLGPVAGPLGRSAFAGRGWEGFSPDPYLTGVAMEQTISGIQSVGVQANAKHWIGNEQETQRVPSNNGGVKIEAVSSNIDDRTMHEVYMWPFANALHAGVASVMCAYNRLNASYACQNSKILNGLLKDELGFQGYVVSDWGGTHSGVASVKAGLDMDMPGSINFQAPGPSYFGGNLTIGVNNGSLTMDRIDDMVHRVMTPYFFLNQDTTYPSIDQSSAPLNKWGIHPYLQSFIYGAKANVDARGAHAKLIRDAAAAGTVLLKNEGNILPLKAPKNIGVFGNDAGDNIDGVYTLNAIRDHGYEYGTLAIGGGSGTGRPTYVVTPMDAIKARAAADGAIVQFILNNNYLASDPNLAFSTFAPSPPDVCLVFLKTWATEGSDRTTLEADWKSAAVVKNVADRCPNTVVITHSGGPNTMPWASHPNVKGILAAHFPGQESGNSIVDILYGVVNPSGKLPYTIANSEAEDKFAPITDSPELRATTDPNAWQSDFQEGPLIDYRHFDYYNNSVLYEFGFGLSYTTFGMANLEIAKIDEKVTARAPAAKTQPGGNPNLFKTVFRVTVAVSNTGTVAGAAVPQLYLSLPPVDGITPSSLRVLRGFEKIVLQPGQTETVTFNLMRRDVSFWDTTSQEWVIASGKIGVHAGFSSRDFKAEGSFTPL
ncbi:hypothetical protein V495_05598 [Pseudogymnoascus sp. VKM F-4514 (FW-929)]|nr:hypothetical protein V495_05598 [Pseudogymnoascus sp. VKM F-4514 (FW-929)]KFY59962.1 hypothetical protein V497_03980 [Pseudogymnoascus sp. VKM F-4516 (FW-969)]